MALELSFRPVFGLDVTILGTTKSFNVSADIPKLDIIVSQVSNVDASCNPASSGKTYNNLTHIVPSLSMDVIVDLDGTEYEPLNSSGVALPTKCLEYDKKAKTFGVPEPTSGAGRGVLPVWGGLILAVVGLVVIGG
jgi:hypothetical protein